MCLDSTVVMRVGMGELLVEGGSSEVDGCFCSSTRCVNAEGSEPALVSGTPVRMGLRSAALTSRAAYWSSLADCLEMVAARNPGVADMIVTEMGQADAGFHVCGASEVREQLMRVGFNAPQWRDLRAGLCPPGQRVDERHVGIPGHGWQHEATEAVHAHLFSTTTWPRLSPPEQA